MRTHSRANDASKTKYERHTNGTATVNGAVLSTRIHFTLPTHVMPDDRRPPSSVHRRLATTARHHLPTHMRTRDLIQCPSTLATATTSATDSCPSSNVRQHSQHNGEQRPPLSESTSTRKRIMTQPQLFYAHCA